MVVSEALIWLHIPKTAGDATLRMFEALDVAWQVKDAHSDPRKHETLAEACQRVPDAGRRAVVANLRRLPELLPSYFHHMQRHAPDERFANGMRFGELGFPDYLDYVLSHPEQQSHDWLLDHQLGDREADHWLRVSELAESFLEVVGRYHRISPEAAARIRELRANEGHYPSADVTRWFRRDQMQALYANCPRWSRTERVVYGDLLLDRIDWEEHRESPR